MRNRQWRSPFLEGDILFDPAWAIVLDTCCATQRGKWLSVSAVLIGSSVPDTTALRKLKVLEERGHVARIPDETDKRRSLVKSPSQTSRACQPNLPRWMPTRSQSCRRRWHIP